MNSLLQFRHLRKSIAGKRLLDIDDFSIPRNTSIILSGRNGAGKSTLLKIIAGLEPPDQAEISWQGETLSWHHARRRMRHQVVYLHQQPYMFDGSVAENIAYGLRHAGLGRTQIRARVDQAMEWARLAHLARRNARHLSGGEKQRVALTRARILSPKLLLLDEPLANMDIESREQSIFLIRRLREDGISTIVTSHEPHIASLIGEEHRHLCKTGPSRYTIVKPFLYQPNIEQEFTLASAHRPVTGTAGGARVSSGDTATSTRSDMKEASPIPRHNITAVILAGGMARRMGGQDKGLVEFNGRPMIEHIIAALTPQTDTLLINANRNLERYRGYGYPVVEDMMGEFFGPLVGMASGMQAADSDYLLSVPCDSPFVPATLAEILYQAMQNEQAQISVAWDGERMQPVFALLRRELLSSLLAYLENGGRKIDTWYSQHRLALADFSAWPDAFLNINTPEDRAALEQKPGHSPQTPPAS